MNEPRNVVMISIDSLRADYCGFLEADRDLTGTMDELASEGVTYRNAIAPGPRTPSSMPAVFTGAHIAERGVDPEKWRERRQRIARHMRRHRPISRRLRDEGYHTLGFNTNPWTTRDTGFDIGFDEFLDFGKEGSISEFSNSKVVQTVDRLLKGTNNDHLFNWHNKEYWFADWTEFIDRIVERLQATETPYYGWIFLTDTHLPYIVPNQYREEASTLGMYCAAVRQNRASSDDPLPNHVVDRLKEAYRDSIRSVDAFIAELRDSLTEDDPALVVHSDHGEAFGEHGTFGHQRQLYEENLHVPLLVYGVDSQSTIETPVSLRSIPSIVEGIADVDGKFDPHSVTENFVTSTVETDERTAVRNCRWKLIRGEDGTEVYDLSTDPKERASRTEDSTQIRDGLERILRLHCEDQTERRRITQALVQMGDSSV